MFAAHFAAALAIKGAAPKAPPWGLLIAVFIPDFVWIALATIGIEPTDYNLWFDEWSHSLLMIVIDATLFASLFYVRGVAVWLPIWIATFYHFLLDWPIHPAPLALYPHSPVHLGFHLWGWGLSNSWWGRTHYWWIQLLVVFGLLAMYVRGAFRDGPGWNLIAASCLIVVSLHFAF